MRLTGSDLAAVRGGRTIFSNLSFELTDGEVLAVAGANGAGKSTLLRLIAGLLKPAAGMVALDPAGEGGVAAVLHYIGHADALKTALTVRQNLDFWRRLWGGGPVEVALERVGLPHVADLPAGVLSAGQRRRVALARLHLVHRPLWLLDEPATSLDVEAETALANMVTEHCAEGGMAAVATHRPIQATATLTLGAA